MHEEVKCLKNILTNLQLRVLAISQSLINVHINLIMNNSAHFLNQPLLEFLVYHFDTNRYVKRY